MINLNLKYFVYGLEDKPFSISAKLAKDALFENTVYFHAMIFSIVYR